MDKVNLIVEHRWDDGNAENVFKTVGDIVGMQKNSKLPEGFTLRSVSLIKGENRAICSWEAPGMSEFEELIKGVNPPTSHSVKEVENILYNGQ